MRRLHENVSIDEKSFQLKIASYRYLQLSQGGKVSKYRRRKALQFVGV